MKIFLFILFLIWGIAFANDTFAQTQMQLNQDAADNYREADLKLNVLCDQIYSLYSADSSFIYRFKASETAWVNYRDAQAEMKYPEEENYGSASPMCVYYYLEELTKERIKALKVWVDGIEEGDICSGSVKVK